MATLITLTTDFGLADGNAAVLEGVIAAINPAARVIPISHSVPPGDIVGGWYLLKSHHRYFPAGTVHLAIVDPGVGSKRKIIVVQTQKYIFVAPDNGLLSFIPRREIIAIRSVTNRKYSLGEISPVFHGRDIMAPAAAYLSLGVDPACLGPSARRMVDLPGVKPARTGKGIVGRVIWVDHFGNLVTNIEPGKSGLSGIVTLCGQMIGPVRKTFSDVRPGQPVAYIGSGGYLEIAVRDGSARNQFAFIPVANMEILVAPKARGK